jgi:hypothetical protein
MGANQFFVLNLSTLSRLSLRIKTLR